VGRAFVTLSEEILSRHARHRDLDESEAMAPDTDDADDLESLPAEPAEFDDLAVLVAGNGHLRYSSRAGEDALDREWSDLEEFPE
jgi:hypothetical protein